MIFDRVGFTINAGERVGLVGRNGHGKTTLFRMIIGEEHPDSGVISTPLNYQVGHLSQHIRFTEKTVLNEGCLSLRKTEDGRDESYKVASILMGLGFSRADFNRNPCELSGGYQVRLTLAKALVSEPNLMLLDEPTNYLDIVSVRWLTQFLRNWKNELILITHDRGFMDSVTTHTMGIHRCKIRKIEGSTAKLYEQILQEEEIYEQTRINDGKKRKKTEQFINRFRAQANKARAVQSRIKALQKKERLEKLSEIKDLDFEFNPAPFMGKQLIGAEHISFSFTGNIPLLLERFSVSIGKKDRIAIIGKNGKGKTTLVNLMAGEFAPLSGQISRHQQLKLAYFGQTNIERLDPHKTVEEEILDVHPDRHRGAARKICGAMMFEGDHALKKIALLSGGEKSRVLLGKLLVRPANLLVLDEPTNHLDMEAIDSLLEAIDAFEGAVIIVTHSEMILRAVATRLIVFDNGKAELFEGTYEDFLDRVGWKDEDTDNVYSLQGTDGQRNAVSKKTIRRLRAEIISSRSRILGPLQDRITEIENAIMRLEQESEQTTNSLLEASVKGDGESIKRLSQSIRAPKESIDALFVELERLTGEFDARSREFDGRLNEFQQEVR
ncbi:MAG: ABC-F family ATP-binding cassette domain-containing protein [Thermodesulfovibrionales bacterium]